MSEGHPFDGLRAGSQTPGKGASPLCTAIVHPPLLEVLRRKPQGFNALSIALAPVCGGNG